MSLLHFDESIRAENLPYEVFKWLSEAAMFARSTTNTAGEIYDTSKLVLRSSAVRNPNSQSNAIRKALGSLIHGMSAQPDSEKPCLDLSNLLIRMVDAKQDNRYNAMKFLAISGLGYLMANMKAQMRQMSVNVFVICLDAIQICPKTPETLSYRITILWTMTQCAQQTIDETLIGSAVKFVRGMIESVDDTSQSGRETSIRAFGLLTTLFELPNAKTLEKKMDRWNALFMNVGSVSSCKEIREVSASFYCVALLNFGNSDFRKNTTAVVNLILKDRQRKQYGIDPIFTMRIDTSIKVVKLLLETQRESDEFETQLDEWLAPLLLQLEPDLVESLFVDGIIRRKLVGDFNGVDIIGVSSRQLALAQAPKSSKQSSKSKSRTVPKANVESVLSCLTDATELSGHSVQPVASSIHQASLGFLFNNSKPLTESELAVVTRCLIRVVECSPTLLLPTLELSLKQLEIASLIPSRQVDISYVLGSMVALTKKSALYSDGNLVKRIMLIASKNIKETDDFFLYSAGWTLQCGIFCLGPHVIKAFVPQSMLISEARLVSQSPQTLHKPLTALMVFLYHNKPLLTPDITNRVGSLLNSVWEDIEQHPAVPLVRRRLLQCYEQLLICGKFDKYPSSLLMKYVAHSTSPNLYSKETGVVIESAMMLPSHKNKKQAMSEREDIPLDFIWETVNSIECGLSSIAAESSKMRSYGNDPDFSIFCLLVSNEQSVRSPPVDVYTSVVDLSLSVSSKILPLQPFRIQESVFDAILANLENSTTVSTFRKTAVVLNNANLIFLILQNDSDIEESILRAIVTILKILLASPLENAQVSAVRSCGLLAKKVKHTKAGSKMLPSLVKELLEHAVDVRTDINLRSGSIIALGYIVEYWTLPSLLEAVFKTLIRLADDHEPLIHSAALEGLKHVLMSADLLDQKYVKQSLKTLISTYLLESHDNFASFSLVVAENLVQVVSRFGPLLSDEKQASSRSRVICLADQLQFSEEPQIRVLAWKSLIELYYYARQGITWQIFIRRWRDVIIDPKSSDEEVDAAVNGSLILVRLSARSIFTISGSSLEDALWLLLDKLPNHEALRGLITSWLSQTSDSAVSVNVWIQRLSLVVMKPRYFFENRLSVAVKGIEMDDHSSDINERTASVEPTAIPADEDVALGVTNEAFSNELFSWEARRFALDLLIQVLKSDLDNKTDAEKASSISAKRVSDLIKVSFTSATSQILGLQYTGLTLLNEIILQMGNLTDPDFAQISLSEQYQVQIIGASSPAFGSESSPGLASVALHTTASFLGSNVVKTKEKLGRLLKTLEDSLSSLRKKDEFRLGKLEMCSDAAKVIRIAVSAVWAEIEISSKTKPHLQSVIEVHEEYLKTFWTDAISTYGRLQSEVDSQWSLSTIDLAIDQMADIQFKMLMIPTFKKTWLQFIRAISALELIDHPEEHQGSLLILCGLCFQAISKTLTQPPQASSVEDEEAPLPSFTNNESLVAYRLSILQTSESISTPAVSCVLITSTIDYIEEIVPISYRVMMIGQPEEQISILSIARNSVAGQPDTDDKVDHFFEILKISILPLRHLFPQLIDSTAQQRRIELNPAQTASLRETMDAVIDIAQVFRDVIKTDLWVSLLRAFEESNHREPSVAAPSFKRFSEILSVQAELRGVGFVVNALTVSSKRAVETESTMESSLISTAIVCTNSQSLVGPPALSYVYRFASRVSDVLDRYLHLTGSVQNESDKSGRSDNKAYIYKDRIDDKEAAVILRLIDTVLRSCSGLPTGQAFAYGCLPVLCKLIVQSEANSQLVRQAAASLTVYGAVNGTTESLAVIVPSSLTLSESEHSTLAGRSLLQIAAKQPSTFKAIVWEMDKDDREVLQQSLAQPVIEDSSSKEEVSEDDSEGEIALTSFV